jgi:hypothetical protein
MHPSGTRDQFFFLLESFFRQLRVCYFVAPSLTRRRVCKLLYNCFWTLPEQSLLGRVPQNSRPYFIVSFAAPPTWRARFPYLYPSGTGWPSYSLGHWIPFLSPLTTRRTTVEDSNPPPHREEWDRSTISYIGIQSVPHRNHITSF